MPPLNSSVSPYMPKLIVATVLLILSLGAVAFTSPLSWSGYDFREVNSFSEIPVGIQMKLGVGKQGIGGVAYFGQPFNFTDVVDGAKPMLRLLLLAEMAALGWSL